MIEPQKGSKEARHFVRQNADTAVYLKKEGTQKNGYLCIWVPKKGYLKKKVIQKRGSREKWGPRKMGTSKKSQQKNGDPKSGCLEILNPSL